MKEQFDQLSLGSGQPLKAELWTHLGKWYLTVSNFYYITYFAKYYDTKQEAIQFAASLSAKNWNY